MIPIACDLTKLTAADRAREAELLDRFRLIFSSPTMSDEGWEMEISDDESVLAELRELIRLERLCCPFLDFHLSIEPGRPARLRIGGPEGAREFIATTFLRQLPR